MIENLPSVLLIIMIVLTLVLLPRLNDEGSLRKDEPKRVTEEIHIRRDRDSE